MTRPAPHLGYTIHRARTLRRYRVEHGQPTFDCDAADPTLHRHVRWSHVPAYDRDAIAHRVRGAETVRLALARLKRRLVLRHVDRWPVEERRLLLALIEGQVWSWRWARGDFDRELLAALLRADHVRRGLEAERDDLRWAVDRAIGARR